MSAYGFGARETDAKNGVIGRWQYHHSETRDALASAEKASTEYERCCSNSGGREVASVEEKVRSKNIFERELERFRDALEKLENCLTMGANSARDFADRQKVLLGFTEKKRLFIAQMEAEEERSSLFMSSSNNSNNNNNSSQVKKLSAVEMTEGMTPEQLLRLQTQQIKSQDQTLHALSRLSTKLKATSGTIYNEIEEQMEIADDLEKDFKLTQMKMKALRKKGHELNGYRKNEIAEQDRKIRLEAEKEREKEIRAKEASQKGFWGWFNS